MSSFILVSPPAVEPVSLAEAKAHARIDTDVDDALVGELISSARQWAEGFTGRAFITQSWKLAVGSPPETRALALPRAPLQSVVSVECYDDDDQASVWNAANYFVDTLHEPGRLVLRIGATWPAMARTANGIIVTYTCGYGDGAECVPEPIRVAIKELVTERFENRGDGRNGNACLAAEALLAPYRVRSLA